MAHEEEICGWMKELVIADKHKIGDLAHNAGFWSAGVSSVNNSTKSLNTLVDQGKLEKGKNFYRLPGCKSEYKEHSQLLTKALVAIKKLNCDTKIIREPSIEEIGLRPDALVWLTKDNKCLCFVLEVCNNERPEFLKQKLNAWKVWSESRAKLSEIFNSPIPDYDIVVSGEHIPEEAFEFNAYLEAIKNE